MLLVTLALISFVMIVAGLLVILKNPKDNANRAFALFLASGAGWLITNYFASDITLNHGLLVFIDRNVMALPAVCLFAILLFVLAISGLLVKISRGWVQFAWLSAIIITSLSYTPLIIANVATKGGINIIEFGPLSLAYFVYAGFVSLAIIIALAVSVHRQRGIARTRLLYIMVSLFLTIATSLITNLLMPLVFGSYGLVQVGPLSTIFIVAGFSYVIIRHRLFEIRLIIARSVTYLLLLATLGLLYGIAVFSLSNLLLAESAGSQTQLILNTVLALVLAFTFQPLRRVFERLTNRLFYRDHYDSETVLSDFTKVLVSEIDLERLLKHALTNLCESLRIEFGQIIVYKHDRVYRIEHYGPLPRRLMVAPELARLNKPMLIADEIGEGERKKLLEGHGVRVSLMLHAREEFVGYLLLGDKLSGDIYSSQDIEVLEIIGKEMAVAVLNAKAYAEIAELNLNLQARIERATKRLRVANRHLKELDRAKDEFISMASHQLRTPLTTIKGYLSMMLEGDAGQLTRAQKDFVSYAFGSSERMVNLISDLLNVSRLQAGRFLIQTKPTDLVRMINDEVRQLEEHAKSKGITLDFQLPSEPLPLVEIDENKTRQVIMNFIDNAIYYTQKGGVTVVLQQAGSRIRFEVRDTGIGVPHEARKKLFSKFFRATNAQTVRPDGTGLGLYLAKRVVEDQGGTIIFESVVGEGSTFGFELPYNPVGATDSHPAHPAKPKREHASHASSK